MTGVFLQAWNYYILLLKEAEVWKCYKREEKKKKKTHAIQMVSTTF